MMNVELETGLDIEVINALKGVFNATPEADEVLIFGSRAKGNFLDGSDIDLAVKGRGITFNTILDLMARIEELGLLYQLDIQDYHSIVNRDIADHIDRVGKTLWRRSQ